MTTRAQAKAATREALIQAGLDLFERHGTEGPSLDAICEHAGRTRGAFYVHFADREAFMVAVMSTILHRYVATIVQSGDPGADLVRTVDTFTEFATQQHRAEPGPQLRLLLEGTRTSEAVREAFVRLIRGSTDTLTAVVSQGQAHGTVRNDLDAGQVAELLVALVLGILAMLETGVADAATVQALRGAILTAIAEPPSPA